MQFIYDAWQSNGRGTVGQADDCPADEGVLHAEYGQLDYPADEADNCPAEGQADDCPTDEGGLHAEYFGGKIDRGEKRV